MMKYFIILGIKITPNSWDDFFLIPQTGMIFFEPTNWDETQQNFDPHSWDETKNLPIFRDQIPTQEHPSPLAA